MINPFILILVKNAKPFRFKPKWYNFWRSKKSIRRNFQEFWEWLKVLEAHGIDILNQCSWGFDLKEPIYKKDIDQFNERTYLIDSHKPKEFFENLYELHQMSKQFKYINEETKILFVRNRIPRALIKSKIKIKASLITNGAFSYQTEGIIRAL